MRSKRRVIGIIIAVVFVFLMSTFLLSNNLIEAQGTKDKQFTSIQVQKGDTLWKIAKKMIDTDIGLRNLDVTTIISLITHSSINLFKSNL